VQLTSRLASQSGSARFLNELENLARLDSQASSFFPALAIPNNI
jgi:hypothetical protein